MATRPFFETLREIRRGQILDDCADELAKAVRAVDETGKPAKLTIELSIKPAAKIPGTYVISDKVRAKLPELPVGETILYGTPEGNLQARDPRQADLELKAVSAEPTMQPEPVPQESPALAEDREFLESILNNTVPDILAPELGDQIGAVYERNAEDAEMLSLIEQAVMAYQRAMEQATASL